MAAVRKLKPRRCRVCGTEFVPRSGLQRVCSPPCAIQLVKDRREEKIRKAERAAQKLAREKVKTPTELAADAQVAFNQYIRERDRHLPCISCGQSPYQGQRHAGHYRSRAAAPQLRFNTANVHAQCAQCNGSKSGNVTEYRIGLCGKIGVKRVEGLEQSNGRANFTDEYLRRLRAVFARRTKHLKRLRERVGYGTGEG